jgi:DNA-binding transcriptional regulator YbjK
VTATGTEGATRRRIMHATLRVIGDRGVAGLTNRLVAAEAGLSLGSLTYHFSSQTDLLRESLMLFVSEEIERITSIAESVAATIQDVGDAAALTDRVLSQMVRGGEEIGVYELYVHAARDPELHEAAQRCFAAYQEVAERVLLALGVARPDRAAGHVVALLAGGQLRRLATGGLDHSDLADGIVMLLS